MNQETIEFVITSKDGAAQVPVQMSAESLQSVARCAFFLRMALIALQKKQGVEITIPDSKDEKGNICK